MFDFIRLAAIFNQALDDDSPTVVFELQDGVGRFVFMLFFSEDDDPSDRHLFIFLARTNVLLSLKLYGNQARGSFQVYPKASDVAAIRAELDIQGGEHPFQVNDLFHRLNENIPQHLPLTGSITALQNHRGALRQKRELQAVIDDATKIYLIGPRRVARGKPREKTLRKLYLYVNGEPETIARIIVALKKANWTLAWSADRHPPPNLLALINEIPGQ